MSNKISQKWTNEEVELLSLNFNKSYKKLQELIPNRSLKSIKHKISNLGLPRQKVIKHYTQDEIDFLKDNYYLSKVELMSHLDRDWGSIRKKLFELGIDYHLGFKYWNEYEVNLLLTVSSIEEAFELFPDRSESSIRNKIVDVGLKLREWSDEETIYLIDNYSKGNTEAIAKELQRTVSSVYVKANRMGLNRDTEFINRVVLSGENHPSWKGGYTSENARLRDSKEFKNWRKEVFERDNYTCQCCGDNTGGNLHAHHIENFSDNPDKRFDILNGITLCNNCHNPSVIGSFHHAYGTKNNNREQLDLYIKSKRHVLI